MGKVILTSQGLCTQMGDRLVHRAISDMGDRENKKILLVDIKKYRCELCKKVTLNPLHRINTRFSWMVLV